MGEKMGWMGRNQFSKNSHIQNINCRHSKLRIYESNTSKWSRCRIREVHIYFYKLIRPNTDIPDMALETAIIMENAAKLLTEFSRIDHFKKLSRNQA